MMQPHTAVDYRTSVTAVVAHAFDPGWDAKFSWPAKTDTEMYAFEPRSRVSVEESTFGPCAPLAIRRLWERLASFQRTAEDERWPGASWPDARAFRDAHVFAGRLRNPMLPTPVISLADDGEINFLWSQDGVHVDLGFYGTGTYSCFALGKHGRGIRAEDIPASEGLPAEITALLTA